MVVGALLKKELPAVSVKPSSMFTAEGGGVKYFFLDPLMGFVNLGIIPVLYGDMVYDSQVGGAILSTDRIFYELANILTKQNIKIDKVIFCGSTDGVLDENGKPIKKITVKNFPTYSNVFFDNKYVDVTGGMKKKVQTALWISKLGIGCRIIGLESLESCIFKDEFE
jgi:isopentenyl phosphate kinase